MLFNSFSFLIFFPIVILINFILPKKVRYLWLLAASYYFYMNWDAKYVLLLLFSTVVTYLSGIALEEVGKVRKKALRKRYAKLVVAVSFVLNLSLLFFFKYLFFTIDSLNLLLDNFNIQIPNPEFSLLLPVGISFYIFQALSYTMDVYRKTIQAERNFFRYALFVSFFPQLVAGPIERSGNLLSQLKEPHDFKYENMRDGLLLMLWGYFMKMVIADRIAIFVDAVYADVNQYTGIYLLIASVLFAFQIYCDFAGYSTIAIGAAEILGIRLMENFNCPYFATNIGEFWRRWHISLSTWFRDYLYIPLGGNRKGTLCKYRNQLIVMLVSGLWHGANWTYVVWGGLHGIYQVMGSVLKPVRDKVNQVLHLKTDSIGHKIGCGIFTFILVDFAWIFFRASSFTEACTVISGIWNMDNVHLLWGDALYQLGLNQKNFTVMIVSIVVLLVADLAKYKGIQIRKIILEQELWCRWLCYIVGVMVILIFGIWGANYDASNFIYFQF